MEIITNYEELNIRNIRVIRPVKVGDNIYMSIKNKNENLYLQTPYLFLRYNPMIYESGYIKFSLDISGEFAKLLEDLEKYIVCKIKNKFEEYTKNIEFSKYSLICRSGNVSSVDFFDKTGKKINRDKVCAGDRVSLLLAVDKYIHNEKQSYINYSILQVQKDAIIAPPPGLALEEKYEKMLRLGVPLAAVRQKITLDGKAPPPPPPLPPPNLLGAKHPSTTCAMSAIFREIKSQNFKLKKVEGIDISNKKEKILKFVDTSKKVPSLQDIQLALQNLKKIK